MAIVAHGIMIESQIMATDVGTLNRYAKGAMDVDGGGLVALAYPTTQGSDVWTATLPATGALGGLYMAYNPSEKILNVAGLEIAGGEITKDPRAYTNLAGKVYTTFKPKVGDEVILTIDCVDASGANAVAGDILESKAGQFKLQRIASATGATSGSTAFKIESVGVQPFPLTNGIGEDRVKAFRALCIQE